MLAAAILLVAFNAWHTANRGSWHGSLSEALTLGPEIQAFAARFDPSLAVHRPYDGQFYYAITYDPWLRTHEVVPLLDEPAYRYRRVLLPALAALVAGGRPTHFPAALLAINVAAYLACGIASWQLARRSRLPPAWLAGGVLVTTGLVYATFRTLTEPLALALVLWGLVAFRVGRWPMAGALLGFAALARDETLLVALAAALHAFFGQRSRRSALVPFLMLAIVPALAWRGYLAHELPPVATSALERLSWPFAGWLAETRAALDFSTTRTILVRTLSVNLVALWLCLEAFLGFRRAPSLWGALVLGQAVLCSLVRGDLWIYYPGSSRLIVPLSVFALFWFVERARAGVTAIDDEGGPPFPRASSGPGVDLRPT